MEVIVDSSAPTEDTGGGILGLGSPPEVESAEILPRPGFVIKTEIEQSAAPARKVFINVCESEHVAEPTTKKKLQEDGTEKEGVSVPLSLGPPRLHEDKGGSPCVVYDVVVHPDVLHDAKSDATGTFRHFLCELALNYVEQKYELPVSHQYKLPRSKYKGEPVKQRIRIKKKAPMIQEVHEPAATSSSASGGSGGGGAGGGARPLIEELPASGSSGSGGGKAASAAPKGAAVVKAAERKAPLNFAKATAGFLGADGLSRPTWQGAVQVEVVVELPGASGDAVLASVASDIKVAVAEEMVAVNCPGFRTAEVVLPAAVRVRAEDGAEARFDCSTDTLRVMLPLASALDDKRGPYAPDFGSKPWLLANALRDESAGADDGNETSAGGGGGGGVDGRASAAAASAPVTKADDDELPEDRFHRADIMSHHLLMQKAAELEETRKRKEAAQRESDERDRLERETKERRDLGLEPAEEDAPFVDDGAEISNPGALDLL